MAGSSLKKAYDRWQGDRSRVAPPRRPSAPVRTPSPLESDAPLGALLGIPPEVVEEYATLAHGVEAALAGSSRKSIIVGSPTKETGVSTVAIGLAATLASNSAAPVLLVDGNLRRPSLHTKFQIERRPGLTDLVRGRVRDHQVRVETGVPHLSVIPCGGEEQSPQSFFKAPEFTRQLNEWCAAYTYVIIDSAPFGQLSDPITLAQAGAGVVLVVQAGRTAREVATEAVETLHGHGVNILGAVLNRRRFYIPEWIYKRV